MRVGENGVALSVSLVLDSGRLLSPSFSYQSVLVGLASSQSAQALGVTLFILSLFSIFSNWPTNHFNDTRWS